MALLFNVTELETSGGACEYPRCDVDAACLVRVDGCSWRMCLTHRWDTQGAVEADEALRGGPGASEAQRRAVQRDPGAREDRDRIFDDLGLAHE
jgi:hypothetical protein